MEFKSITANFEEKSGVINLGDFLEEISLIADVSQHTEDGNEITLMTIHSAKGLEFKVVFLSGIEDHIIPSSRALEEDSRNIDEERRGLVISGAAIFIT